MGFCMLFVYCFTVVFLLFFVCTFYIVLPLCFCCFCLPFFILFYRCAVVVCLYALFILIYRSVFVLHFLYCFTSFGIVSLGFRHPLAPHCVFLLVELTLVNATYCVVVSDADPSQVPPPLRIDNVSFAPIIFKQVGLLFEERLTTHFCRVLMFQVERSDKLQSNKLHFYMRETVILGYYSSFLLLTKMLKKA